VQPYTLDELLQIVEYNNERLEKGVPVITLDPRRVMKKSEDLFFL